MSDMFKLSEVTKLTGVTRRSLQEYNAVGLLKPTIKENGHWYYNNADINKLNLIQIFVEAGYTRKEIREILCKPADSEFTLYRMVVEKLEEKKKRINGMINTLNMFIELETVPKEILMVFSKMDASKVYSSESFKNVYNSMIDECSDYDAEYEEDMELINQFFIKLLSQLYVVGIHSKNNPCDKIAQKAADAVYGQFGDMVDFLKERGFMSDDYSDENFYDEADGFLQEMFWDNEELVNEMETKFEVKLDSIKESFRICRVNR